MGTRGAIGFHVNGEDKLTYNHFDSYPEGLGQNIVDMVNTAFAQGGTIEQLRERIAGIKVIDNDSEPTAEDFEKYAPWHDKGVSTGKDWYSLLRNTQGNLLAIMDAGAMIVDNKFIMDSLFCEYAYIINIDDGTLECYTGFQSQVHNQGRYGGEVPDPVPYDNGHVPDKYYGCRLVGTFPLDAIPENWIEIAYPEEIEADDQPLAITG